MSRPIVNPGTLKWSGEHWINYIREPEADACSGMVSLYLTRYSSAGEGAVAFVDILGKPDYQGLYTDNVTVAGFIQEMIQGRNNPFDRQLPIRKAQLSRTGDIQDKPGWLIEDGQHQIMATWSNIQPPVIAEAPAPTFGPDRDFFTLLFFADEAAITVNGETIEGTPYPRDIWQASLGGERSSCVFALAETMIMVDGNEQ